MGGLFPGHTGRHRQAGRQALSSWCRHCRQHPPRLPVISLKNFGPPSLPQRQAPGGEDHLVSSFAAHCFSTGKAPCSLLLPSMGRRHFLITPTFLPETSILQKLARHAFAGQAGTAGGGRRQWHGIQALRTPPRRIRGGGGGEVTPLCGAGRGLPHYTCLPSSPYKKERLTPFYLRERKPHAPCLPASMPAGRQAGMKAARRGGEGGGGEVSEKRREGRWSVGGEISSNAVRGRQEESLAFNCTAHPLEGAR